MIKTNDEQFPVKMMCRILSVSRSGYYAWKHRPQSDRSQANKLLVDDIKRIFDDTHRAQVKKSVPVRRELPNFYRKKVNQ